MEAVRVLVFRGRERLVHQRTADVNAPRALLYEHGHVFPAGISHLDRMTALVEDEASDLPALIREECQDLLAQIAEKRHVSPSGPRSSRSWPPSRTGRAGSRYEPDQKTIRGIVFPAIGRVSDR